MLGLAARIGNSIKKTVAPVTGLIWRNWTASWTSLNDTWNTYN